DESVGEEAAERQALGGEVRPEPTPEVPASDPLASDAAPSSPAVSKPDISGEGAAREAPVSSGTGPEPASGGTERPETMGPAEPRAGDATHEETLRQVGDLRNALREEIARDEGRREDERHDVIAETTPAPPPQSPARPASGRSLAIAALVL